MLNEAEMRDNASGRQTRQFRGPYGTKVGFHTYRFCLRPSVPWRARKRRIPLAIQVPVTTIATGDVILQSNPDDTVHILPDVDIISQENTAIVGAVRTFVRVQGTAEGQTAGIRLGVETPGGEVFVGNTGHVGAVLGAAIRGEVTGNGEGSDFSVVNHGDVSNHGADPSIWLSAPLALSGAGSMGEDLLSGGSHTVLNTGRIVKQDVLTTATAAIFLEKVGKRAEIVNATGGLISAFGPDDSAILIESQVFNEVGLSGSLFENTSDIFFTNSGEIFARSAAFTSLGRSNNTVENSGLITGDIQLGEDPDTVTNSGRIVGSVFLGDGGDRYNGRGGTVSDAVSGGTGSDTLIGGDGDDVLGGNTGFNRIRGGAGDDTLSTQGTGVIRGGSGDDNISSAFIGQQAFGGSGDDTIKASADFDGAFGSNLFDGGVGDDEIELRLVVPLMNDASVTVLGNDGHDRMTVTESNERIEMRGGRGEDTLTGSNGAETLSGGRGDDIIIGNQGVDWLLGGRGDDSLSGGTGNSDRLFGGQGDDTLDGGTGNNTIKGGAGDDSIFASNGRDEMHGGKDDDTLKGGQGVDTLRGGAGDDSLVGGASNSDRLFGGKGDDTLDGGQGSNRLDGGLGNDSLTASTGADDFIYNPGDGRDTIDGFDVGGGNDQIDLRGWGLGNFAALTSTFSVSSTTAGALIDFGDGDSILLVGLAVGTLNNADFLF